MVVVDEADQIFSLETVAETVCSILKRVRSDAEISTLTKGKASGSGKRCQMMAFSATFSDWVCCIRMLYSILYILVSCAV